MDTWRKEVLDTFAAIASRTDTREMDIDGKKLIIEPDVFAPDYFTDSLWFATELSRIAGVNSLLEIGTGTGIIALAAAQRGAYGLATDINPAALRNATVNLKGTGFEVRESDIYNGVRPDERFDFIFWNHPFNDYDVKSDAVLLRAGFDKGFSGLERYVAGARNHLAPNGRLLLGTGGIDGAHVTRIAQRHGYRFETLAQTSIPLVDRSDVPNEYKILELVGE